MASFRAAAVATLLAVAATLAAGAPSPPFPPPTCPTAIAGDTGGALLNNGPRVDACGTCAAICGAFPGCNAYTWGTPASARFGECWLKHTDGGALAIRPATALVGQWVSATVPTTPRNACPAGAEWRADVDGAVLAMRMVPTCVSCEAACRSTGGCNVWVFGFVGAGPRADRQYQCWLKRVAPRSPTVYKAGSFATDSPWVSGRL